MQAYWTFGWDRKFQLWCNPNDSGSSFGPHGYKLARVLWIHYISKVRTTEFWKWQRQCQGLRTRIPGRNGPQL